MFTMHSVQRVTPGPKTHDILRGESKAEWKPAFKTQGPVCVAVFRFVLFCFFACFLPCFVLLSCSGKQSARG